MHLKAYANHLKGVQVMATISLQFSNTFQCFLQAENSMTGTVEDMGEVLIQVWKKFIKKQVEKQSECIKREYFQGSHRLLQAHETSV